MEQRGQREARPGARRRGGSAGRPPALARSPAAPGAALRRCRPLAAPVRAAGGEMRAIVSRAPGAAPRCLLLAGRCVLPSRWYATALHRAVPAPARGLLERARLLDSVCRARSWPRSSSCRRCSRSSPSLVSFQSFLCSLLLAPSVSLSASQFEILRLAQTRLPPRPAPQVPAFVILFVAAHLRRLPSLFFSALLSKVCAEATSAPGCAPAPLSEQVCGTASSSAPALARCSSTCEPQG